MGREAFNPINVEEVADRLARVLAPVYDRLEIGRRRPPTGRERWLNPFVDPEEERELYAPIRSFVQALTIPKYALLGTLDLGDDRSVAEFYVEEGAIDPEELNGYFYQRAAFAARDDIETRDGGVLSRGSIINLLVSREPERELPIVRRKDFVPGLLWGYNERDFSDILTTDLFVPGYGPQEPERRSLILSSAELDTE